jgi:hypothetical protein
MGSSPELKEASLHPERVVAEGLHGDPQKSAVRRCRKGERVSLRPAGSREESPQEELAGNGTDLVEALAGEVEDTTPFASGRTEWMRRRCRALNHSGRPMRHRTIAVSTAT